MPFQLAVLPVATRQFEPFTPLPSRFAVDVNFVGDPSFHKKSLQNQTEDIHEYVVRFYEQKMQRTAELAYPFIKHVYETQGDRYVNIVFPFTDGKLMYQIPVNLKESYETNAKSVVKAFQKAVLLHTIDDAWKEHLRTLDQLRDSVQNASYEHKDPLLIYKLESFNLFKKMIDEINFKASSILMRAQIPTPDPERVREAEQKRQDYSNLRTQKSDIMRAGQQDTRERQKTQPIRAEKTVGRNDPCPCGSGKKYKNCCGKDV
ncbi:MAG: SEC-C domain-containing protein [Paludibacteraceae bacterium]|nr:SEC-C domain-containing protein [Paludibacteraceae bacterium]